MAPPPRLLNAHGGKPRWVWRPRAFLECSCCDCSDAARPIALFFARLLRSRAELEPAIADDEFCYFLSPRSTMSCASLASSLAINIPNSSAER